MDTQAARLEYAKTELGITAARMADDLGVSRQVVSDWFSGRTLIRRPNGIALQALYGISWKWLLEGEGPIKLVESPVVQFSDSWVARPIIPGAASCGPGGEIADPGQSAIRIPFRKSFLQELCQESGGGAPESMFLVECVGDSMRPTVMPGDLALINTALQLRMNPKRSGLYLVRTDPESTDGRVKRVRLDHGRLWFMSDAPGFPPVALEIDGIPLQSVVLGRVCWIARSVLRGERADSDW